MAKISDNLLEAKQLLDAGNVVAIPTETVYGLAANATDIKAIDRIFEIKNRPRTNPLILHTHSIEKVSDFVSEFPDWAKKLGERFWPGPLTIVMPKADHISDVITAKQDTVAIRIPNHELTLKLLATLDYPLVAPSANPFTRISPTSASIVNDYFSNDIPFILDGGNCQKGIESTIIGMQDGQPVIYRHGIITQEMIEEELGMKVKTKAPLNTTITPGMSKKHYAPITTTLLSSDLLSSIAEALKTCEACKIGVIFFTFHPQLPADVHQIQLTQSADLEEASSNLYRAMYDLDQKNMSVIIIEEFPNHGIGKSLNDRLSRASS